MCVDIVINRGEKEISTPYQFLKHFGFLPVLDDCYSDLMMDSCLCQVDIPATFELHNIPFKSDFSSYYVGDLDNVILY